MVWRGEEGEEGVCLLSWGLDLGRAGAFVPLCLYVAFGCRHFDFPRESFGAYVLGFLLGSWDQLLYIDDLSC